MNFEEMPPCPHPSPCSDAYGQAINLCKATTSTNRRVDNWEYWCKLFGFLFTRLSMFALYWAAPYCVLSTVWFHPDFDNENAVIFLYDDDFDDTITKEQYLSGFNRKYTLLSKYPSWMSFTNRFCLLNTQARENNKKTCLGKFVLHISDHS